MLSITAPAFAQAASNSAVESKIQANEKALWDAWKNHDAKPFNEFLTDDGINVVGNGSIDKGKAAAIKGVTSTDCTVNSFDLSDFSYVWLDGDTVIMTYSATQDATCKGTKIPAKVTASSAWSKKGDKWLTGFHQESPVM
jgi:ketosteroid isomerase-like protein